MTRPLALLRAYLLILAAGIGLATLVPPMSAPDEITHLARAGLLANGQLLLSMQAVDDTASASRKQELVQSGGAIDSGLSSYIHSFRRFIVDPNARPSAQDEAAMRSLQWSGANVFEPMAGTGYYLPVVYLPHAVGLTLGRAMNLSIHGSYQIARGLVIAGTLAILTWTFAMVRPPVSQVALLLLPMSLFQAIAPVLDGLTNALALFVIVSTCLSWREGTLGGRWRIVAYFSTLFILLTTRVHLFPMLLLALALAWHLRSRRLWLLGTCVGAAALMWDVYSILATVDLRVLRPLSTLELARTYASSPASFARVMVSTLSDSRFFSFYWQSFVGILGWLDSPLLRPFYWVLTIALLFLIVLDIGPGTARDLRLRVVLAFSAASACVLAFFAMLITWTPHPAIRIEGIQGRYFLVPAMLMVAALTDWGGASFVDPFRRIRTQAYTIFTTTALLALVQTVLNRYH